MIKRMLLLLLLAMPLAGCAPRPPKFAFAALRPRAGGWEIL